MKRYSKMGWWFKCDSCRVPVVREARVKLAETKWVNKTCCNGDQVGGVGWNSLG